MRVRVRVRVSECGRKIRNANDMPKSDEGGKVGGRQGDKEEERGGGEREGGVGGSST